jgi:hypothetical protein
VQLLILPDDTPLLIMYAAAPAPAVLSEKVQFSKEMDESLE